MNSQINKGQEADRSEMEKRANQLLLAITNKILRQYDYNDLSDLAIEKASSKQQARAVVVVGEVKRGKSSLVNALVGKRNASPVGVNVTTSTPIALTLETESLHEGQACLFYPDGERIIPHTELDAWINAGAVRDGEEQADSLPTRATIPLRTMPLGNATIIDTPGVGGLDPKLSNLAKVSIDQACVVVVVCDASTTITKPEMDFIRDTGSNIEAIIVAVTKTDKHLIRWQEIVEENKRLLRAHLGRDIPVVGVSSLLAVVGAEMGSSPMAHQVLELSGIHELNALISKKFQIAEFLPLANGLRIAVKGLHELADELTQKLEILRDGDAAVPDLSHRLAELNQLKKEGETWDYYLGRDLTLIRQASMEQLEMRLDALRESWTERINKQGMAVLRKNPQYFTSEMEREFQTAIAESINYFSYELEHKIVRPRFKSEMDWEDIRNEVSSAFAGKQLQTHSVQQKSQGLLDPMMLMMGISGGSMLGGVVGSVVTFAGLGAIVGVGWVAFNVGFRAMRSGKTNLLNWMKETTGTAKMLTSKLLEAAIANARPAIQLRYRENLKQMVETTQKQIQEAERAARADKASRDKRKATLEKNLQIVQKNIATAEATIRDLTAYAAAAAKNAQISQPPPAAPSPAPLSPAAPSPTPPSPTPPRSAPRHAAPPDSPGTYPYQQPQNPQYGTQATQWPWGETRG